MSLTSLASSATFPFSLTMPSTLVEMPNSESFAMRVTPSPEASNKMQLRIGLAVLVGMALETIPRAVVSFSLLNASFIEPSSLSYSSRNHNNRGCEYVRIHRKGAKQRAFPLGNCRGNHSGFSQWLVNYCAEIFFFRTVTVPEVSGLSSTSVDIFLMA